MRSVVDTATGEIMDEDFILHEDGVIVIDDEAAPATTERWLADSYMQVQRTRIAMENRLRSFAQGSDPGTTLQQTTTVAVLADLEHAEKMLSKLMNLAFKSHATYPWLSQVKGVSGVLAVQLLGLLDVEKAPCISSFWKFCGLAVTEGERDRLTKGEKAPYSKRAKVVCWKIGDSFIKCNSPFRRVYDEKKAYYEANRPEWSPMRRHRAAMRVMEKTFLSCLWQVWREAEGLPVSQPYAQAHLGHVHIDKPEDFI